MTKISEVVKLKTGYAKDTVYRWISERNMPGHKIGRLWKFNKMEVDEWVRGGGADAKRRQKKTDRQDW